MCKPTLVTLPLLLLLLDFWPLGRLGGPARRLRQAWHLLPEKAPLALLAALSSAVTLLTQGQGGAIQKFEAMPVELRIGNAALSYVAYLGKLLWPARLAVYYPYPGRDPALTTVLPAALLLAGITLLALWHARRRPWLAAGWFWFAGALVPMIGIVQVGSQAMADRYLYLPSIGILVALVWLVADLGLPRRLPRWLSGALAGSLLAALAAATILQASYWKDSETLFGRTLAVTTGNVVIHMALADFLEDERRFGEALAHAREAVRLRPGAAVTHGALGNAFAALGRHGEAVAAYREALGLGSDQPEIPYNLGNSLAALGRHGEATAAFGEALRRRPGHANAHANLAASLAALGRDEEAITSYQRALRIRPDFGDAFSLGLLLERRGRSAEALASYREALTLRPNAAEVKARVAALLGNAGGR
jgi:tetratricopeptide (TPR) repeat protein